MCFHFIEREVGILVLVPVISEPATQGNVGMTERKMDTARNAASLVPKALMRKTNPSVASWPDHLVRFTEVYSLRKMMSCDATPK